MRRILVLVLVLGFCTIVFAQAPAPSPQPAAPGAPVRDAAPPQKTGTGVIRGRVVTGDTAAPLRRAQIHLTAPELREARDIATDDQGRYEIKELPAGRYTLSASKSGYVSLSLGQRRPLEAARPIALADAQVLEKADFALPKGSVILVHVTDDFGEAMAAVSVQVQQFRFSGGQRQLQTVSTAGIGFAGGSTDDLGQARIYGIPPGDYYVSASARAGVALTAGGSDQTLMYAQTYFPGTADAGQAQRVTLGIGQEVSVSFPLVVIRGARISGVIRSSDGTPLVRPALTLAQRIGSATSIRGVPPPLPDGSFVIANLPPGDYSINASSGANGDAPESAAVPVPVSGDDITGLVITTTRGSVAHGQVVFDGGAPPRNIRPGGLALALSSGTTVPVLTTIQVRWKWNDDWTFDASEARGSRLIRLGPGVNGWWLKAVMLDGKDVTDIPIDFDGARDVKDIQVVLTEKQTTLTGTAVDAHNVAATDYVAILFPEDRQLWTPQSRFIGTGRPDQQGTFKIAGLPPGRYFGAAVDYIESGAERDPDVLDRLKETAMRVTLGEGESKAIALTLVSD